MLPRSPQALETLYNDFSWRIPEKYNIGVDVCDRWAEANPKRTALIVAESSARAEWTYGDLKTASDKCAVALRAHGVERGDRIAILLPQRVETLICHLTAYKLGAIAVPLFTLFGVDSLRHRLYDSGAKLCIADRERCCKLNEIRATTPALKTVLCVDGTVEGAEDFHAALANANAFGFEPVETSAEDPALLIYTSGTTGSPKGALHAHRVLLGHLPGVEMSHNLAPQPGDRFWTPADWAWIGGLLNVLMPALHHGVPVVARRFNKFSGEEAFKLLAQEGVRNAFLPPTALKIMHGVNDPPTLSMRSVASGGEALGAALQEWGRKVFGVQINEFYGQTECNMVLSQCDALQRGCPGVTGFPVPGHDISVIDDAGDRVAMGVEGAIAIRRPNPAMFLEYWNDDAATARKFRGDWLVTGDRGVIDDAETGAIRFIGREDDVITSSGYRIGPGEIEDCLLAHPAVRMAGVVGKPDPLRTEIVKAFVVLEPGVADTCSLTEEIQQFVRERMAAHAYPREIAYVAELPLTTTGKIIRAKLREEAGHR
jgi:acetyl-CoA synthetase